MTKFDIKEKQDQFSSIKLILKREFFGLDKIIDQLTNLIEPWYIFPDFNNRPTVINLYGLTGCGKTSLVKRLVSLLNLEKKTLYHTMSDSSALFFREIDEIKRHDENDANILIFDEFQNARSIDDNGMTNRRTMPDFWHFLDSGMVERETDWRGINELRNSVVRLNKLIKLGIRVTNGTVTKGMELFITTNRSSMSYIDYLKTGNLENCDDDDLVFFQDYHDICNLPPYYLSNEYEVLEELTKMNGRQTIDFIQGAIDYALEKHDYDLRNSLVLILGNLDDAYSMVDNVNPDSSADSFHQESLKINIHTIKTALLNYFKPEQVARLGNNILIYPAFSEKTFRQIIEKELLSISSRVKREFNLNVQFEPSTINLIYREGVFPAQGTRAVYSSIYNLISSKIPKIIMETRACEQADSIELVKISNDNDNLVVSFLSSKKEIILKLHLPLFLSLKKLRKPPKDNTMTIRAVHESGHACVAIDLLNIIPIEVRSSSIAEGGYTRFEMPEYFSISELVLYAAVSLAGFIAEKQIFGSNKVTSGSSDDIQRTTTLIVQGLRELGLLKLQNFGMVDIQDKYKMQNAEAIIHTQAKSLLEKAETLAKESLMKNKRFLIKLADYLSDNPVIKHDEILVLAKKNINNFNEKPKFSYRKKLKEVSRQISNLHSNETSKLYNSNPIIKN